MAGNDDAGAGLDIFFDQTAETGFRQTRLGGYDRRDVDAYVREAEQRLRSQQQRIQRLEARLAETQQAEPTVQLPAAAAAPRDPDEGLDVGSRTTAILQLARDQGRQVLDGARRESDRIMAAGRTQAQEIIDSALREAEDIRLTTQEHAEDQRARLERETGDAVARTSAEAEILLDRARQQAAVVEHEAVTLAARTREDAQREADVIRQEAMTQAAQWRLEAENVRSEVLTALQVEHREATEALAATLAEHTAQRQQANEELTAVVAEATRIRNEAVVEADATRTRVLRETENQITVARTQAQVSLERGTQRHAERIEALKREIASLQQRRQGIVTQLSSLSALVTATAGEFGDDPGDPLDADLDDEPQPAVTAGEPAGDGGDEGRPGGGRPEGQDRQPSTLIDAETPGAGSDDATTVLPAVGGAGPDGSGRDGTGPDGEGYDDPEPEHAGEQTNRPTQP